jgi:hypothetical protein
MLNSNWRIKWAVSQIHLHKNQYLLMMILTLKTKTIQKHRYRSRTQNKHYKIEIRKYLNLKMSKW